MKPIKRLTLKFEFNELKEKLMEDKLIYSAPLCETAIIEAFGLLCVSGSATGENFGPGTDFGGKDKWEETRW